MIKADAVFSLVDLTVKVAEERSKQCTYGNDISYSYALGAATTSLAYFIDRLDLSKKQMAILEAEFANLEAQYNILTKD